MHRAVWSLLIAGLGACARPAATPAAALPSACDAVAETEQSATIPVWPEPEWGARVTAVELRGVGRVPSRLVRAAIGTRAGDVLDEERVAADVTRIHALEAFAQVAAETEPTAGGVRLRFVLEERALIGRVEQRGQRVVPLGLHLPLAEGELHDPARVRRAAQGLEDHLVDSGHLDARVHSRERRRGDRVDVCFSVESGPRYLIAEIAPVGNQAVPSAELLALVDDHEGKVNRPGAPFRADLSSYDRLRIQALYYDRGFLDVAVAEPRVVRNERARTLRVEWPIHEGGVYRLAKIDFAGKLAGREALYRQLLGLETGQIFSRAQVAAGLARIREQNARLGLSPQTELDPHALTVSLSIQVEEAEK